MALQVLLSHGTPIRSRHSTVCNRNSGAHLRVTHRLAPAARSSHKHWGRVEMTSLRQISTALPSRGVRIDGWDWGTPVAIAFRVAANAAGGTTTRAAATMHARATAAHRISTALPSIGQTAR